MSEFQSSLDELSSPSPSIPLTSNIIQSELGELQEIQVSDEIPDDIDDVDKAKIFMELCRSYDKIINGSSELININHVINIINKQ